MRELVMRGRWLFVALVVLTAPRAMAQSAAERAQSLFDEGLKQKDAGHIAEACTAFEESQRLDPKLTPLLNLAACREQNGQLATAWELFTDASAKATAAGDARLAQVATSRADKLAPRLSHLVISVPADRQIAGLAIARGKDPIAPSSWNHPLPIDGGTYTVTASAPGRESWSTTRAIKAEGDTQTIEIPALAESGTPVAGHDLVTDAAPAGQPSYALPIAFGGGAVVLGGVALGLELWSERIYDRATARNAAASAAMANSDTPSATRLGDEAEALRSSAVTRRYLAQGFGAAAVACAGVAVYLYVRDRGESRPTAIAMTPVVAPDLAGVALVGRW
jgi:hypothetical protein